jgi:phenylacetate-coenzyme A ligase PaaK-like adenylate-forming protein
MAETLAIAGLVGSAVGAVGSLQQGAAQSSAYQFQAQQALQQAEVERLKGRREALQYRQQGLAVLDNTLKNMARINAVAGAGGISPFSGSPTGLRNFAQREGAFEYHMAADNADIANMMGDYRGRVMEAQAAQLQGAAKQAKKAGMFGAVSSLAMGAFSAAQTGLFDGMFGSTAAGAGTGFSTYGTFDATLPWKSGADRVLMTGVY